MRPQSLRAKRSRQPCHCEERKRRSNLSKRISILLVAGARPNFVKILPLIREFKKHPKRIKYTLVHTGQHYDANMSKVFFKDLDIPKPDIFLNTGSAEQGAQTARIIEGIEKILIRNSYDMVIVVGDVNSTVAAALAAVKLGVKVAHVEAGLRSFDRNMPEEINRVLTDHISDILFTTETSGTRNLIREGISRRKIFFTGNIMLDSQKINSGRIAKSKALSKLGLKKEGYCLVTIHRPSNVDDKKDLKSVTEILSEVSCRIDTVLPLHPRTEKALKKHGIRLKGVRLVSPLGYVDFQALLKNAKLVMTDSGGIQEEAAFYNIPCITLRENTERPVTINKGTNELAGTNKAKIKRLLNKILKDKWKKAKHIPLWDGKAAKRIVDIILTT